MKRSVHTNGPLLVQSRINLGFTQEVMAEKCDVAVNSLRTAEHGGPVALAVISAIADFLEVPCHTLYAPDPQAANRIPEAWWKGLPGRWTGTIEQPEGPDGGSFTGDVEMDFVREGDGIRGRYSFSYLRVRYDCEIRLVHLFERYFKFDAAAEGSMFNTFYFQINPAGDAIEGRYIGFGPHSNRIVTGVARGKKSQNAAS